MPFKERKDKRRYQRRWKAARRKRVIESMGGRCAQCGATRELEVDHVRPETKEIRITCVITMREATRRRELAKCQLLCKTCHIEKTAAELSRECDNVPF